MKVLTILKSRANDGTINYRCAVDVEAIHSSLASEKAQYRTLVPVTCTEGMHLTKLPPFNSCPLISDLFQVISAWWTISCLSSYVIWAERINRRFLWESTHHPGPIGRSTLGKEYRTMHGRCSQIWSGWQIPLRITRPLHALEFKKRRSTCMV